MTIKTVITSLAFASLVLGASVSAGTLLDKEINDGSAPMYSQVTHTGNVVFINASEEVFFPCRCHIAEDDPVVFTRKPVNTLISALASWDPFLTPNCWHD